MRPLSGWRGQPLSGSLHTLRIDSALLRDNPLGDPSLREVIVYRPPGAVPVGGWSAIYLLPAYGSRHRVFVADDLWRPNVVQRFDQQVREGSAAPALLVMPDAGNRLGGSQFVDSPGTGPYQSFLADEVTAAVEVAFGAAAIPEARAVAGRSSGGFGALRLGLDRPDKFQLVAAHAPDAHFALTLPPILLMAASALARAGGVPAFLAQVEAQGPQGVGAHDALFVLAAAAAYAGRADGDPPFGDLPFTLPTAQLQSEVWPRYLAQDPVWRLQQPGARPPLRWVYLDAGDADEYGLHFAVRALATQLRAASVPLEVRSFAGGHRGTRGRYTISLPMLSSALRQHRHSI
ncbi:MAG: alpha/beta hydrolase-fold protein [Polyangiales bacterium]